MHEVSAWAAWHKYHGQMSWRGIKTVKNQGFK